VPLSLVVSLEPQEEAELPANLGRALHAALLRLVDEASPALASALHDDDGPRPFTVSNLWGAHRAGKGSVRVSKGTACWARFTSLDGELSGLLRDAFLGGRIEDLELDGTPFGVTGATADAGENAWAGDVGYGELSQTYLLAEEEPAPGVALEFATPTTFRARGMNVPLPTPELVFGSLLRNWNAFAPVALSEEVVRYAAECVAVARYRLQTRVLDFGVARQVGFLGRCRFVALKRDNYWLSLINLLADFALYGGVGYKTTMGMGQTRRVHGRL